MSPTGSARILPARTTRESKRSIRWRTEPAPLPIECAQCGESTDDGTEECPNCGYHPSRAMLLAGGVIFGIGLITSLFILGIPIAIYGLYRIYRSRHLTVESEYAL